MCALAREVILCLVDLCMKIKEIDDHALHCVAGQIQIEPMAFFFVPRAHVFHVFIAPLLLAGIEVHHRIIEKHHLTAHAVIAERGGHLCKFRRHVDGYGTEIGAGVGYLRLLRNPNVTIQELTDLFGFSSVSHLNRYVKNQLGVNPNEVRK